METITSRHNSIIRRLRSLGRDRAARNSEGVFVCDGEKLLREALASGAEVETVLWAEKRAFAKWGHAYAETSELRYNPPMIIRANTALSAALSLAYTLRIPLSSSS